MDWQITLLIYQKKQACCKWRLGISQKRRKNDTTLKFLNWRHLLMSKSLTFDRFCQGLNNWLLITKDYAIQKKQKTN